MCKFLFLMLMERIYYGLTVDKQNKARFPLLCYMWSFTCIHSKFSFKKYLLTHCVCQSALSEHFLICEKAMTHCCELI